KWSRSMRINRRPTAIIRQSCSDSSLAASQRTEFSEATGTNRLLSRSTNSSSAKAGSTNVRSYLADAVEGTWRLIEAVDASQDWAVRHPGMSDESLRLIVETLIHCVSSSA